MALALAICRRPAISRSLQRFATVPHQALATNASNGATSKRRLWLSALGFASAAGGFGLYMSLERSLQASGLTLHPQKLPWTFNELFGGFDHQSIRRGYQVYKQVCASCHSLEYIYYRHFVDVFMTEDEARAEAAEAQIEDGPNDEGKMFKRERKLFDRLPVPYANEKMAKLANNGAVPPDLTLITEARHGNEDYIFALLTGYQECPAGVELATGQAYNPYFSGGVLSMAQQLFDEGVEYDDGTPPTQSQQAKDVVTFLKWCANQETDTRKRYALKILFALPIAAFVLLYWKRHVWTLLKTQKFAFKTLPGREPPSARPPKSS